MSRVQTITLGANANPAVSAVNALNAAVKPLNITVSQLGTTIGQYNQAATTAQATTNKFSSTLQTLTNNIRGTGLNIIINGLKKVGDEFLQAIERAREFNKAITQIKTITQDSGLSTEQWANRLTTLSTAFGVPQTKLAEAAYEAFQSQLVNSTNATEFLTAAIQLSKVQNLDLTKTVNVLTATLNAYGKSANEATLVSAQLFKAAEVGQFRIEGLASQIGRTAVTASELGVPIEELLAGLAALTRQGISADTAQTQLLNIFTKLLNPVGEMKEFIQGLGFETGQALIQARGFKGVLELLGQEIDRGGISRAGELARDIRAVQGVLGLTNDGFAIFEDSLQKIKSPMNTFNNAINEVNASLDERLNKTMLRTQNFLESTFGRPLLEFKTNFLTGIDAFIDIFVKFEETVSERSRKISVAITKASDDQSKKFLEALKISENAYTEYAAAIRARTNALLKDVVKQHEQAGKAVEGIFNTVTDDIQRSINAAGQEARDAQNAADRITNQIAQNIEETERRAFEARLARAGDREERRVVPGRAEPRIPAQTEAGREIQKINDEIKKANDQNLKSAVQRFNQNEKLLAKERQRLLINQRVNELNEEGIRLIETAQLPNIELGNKKFQEANALLARSNQLLIEIGERPPIGEDIPLRILDQVTGKLRAATGEEIRRFGVQKQQVSSLNTVNGLEEARVQLLGAQNKALELAAQKLREQSQEALKREEREKANLVRLREALKVVTNTDIIKKGESATEQEIRESILNRVAAEEEIFRLAPESARNIEFLSRLEELRAKTSEALAARLENARAKEAETAGKAIIKQREDEAKALKTSIDSQNTAVTQGFERIQKESEELAKFLALNTGRFGFSEAENRLGSLLKRLQELLPVARQDAQALEELRTTLNQINVEALRVTEQRTGVPAQQIQLPGGGTLAEESANRTKINEALIRQGQLLLQNIEKQRQLTQAVQPELALAQQQTATLLSASSAASTLAASLNIGAIPAAQTLGLSLADSGLQGQTALLNIASSSQTATQQVQSLTNELRQLVQFAQQAASAFAQIGLLSGTGLGGFPAFQHGGLVTGPKGSDKILARLTHGEFVMPPGPTKKFYTELMAMRAGHKPPGFAAGGLVTNNNVGDINVIVRGGDTKEKTLRNVAQGLRRGIRRGIIQLN